MVFLCKLWSYSVYLILFLLRKQQGKRIFDALIKHLSTIIWRKKSLMETPYVSWLCIIVEKRYQQTNLHGEAVYSGLTTLKFQFICQFRIKSGKYFSALKPVHKFSGSPVSKYDGSTGLSLEGEFLLSHGFFKVVTV